MVKRRWSTVERAKKVKCRQRREFMLCQNKVWINKAACVPVRGTEKKAWGKSQIWQRFKCQGSLSEWLGWSEERQWDTACGFLGKKATEAKLRRSHLYRGVNISARRRWRWKWQTGVLEGAKSQWEREQVEEEKSHKFKVKCGSRLLTFYNCIVRICPRQFCL